MFQNEDLKNHLESSFTLESQSALIAEWNMNVPGNIFKLGNYRYRPSGTTIYNSLPNIFDNLDSGNYYTGATDADITIENGFEADGTTPLLFTFKKEKEKLYYSLEDCIKPFRPRSGINKCSFFTNKFLSHPNEDMYLRPRYYMPSKDDEFKYWRSYRTEGSGTNLDTQNIEYGISKASVNNVYPIEDAVPFVVYKEEVPANRIIIKVQTNIGNIDLGPFKNSAVETFSDPFYGDSNKTTPQKFTVQYLNANNEWIDAYSFDETSTRLDGSAIFNYDGYLSLQYGLQIPQQYQNNFLYVGKISSLTQLPDESITGYAYLLQEETYEQGLLYIWNGTDYDEFVPDYSWSIGTDGVYENTQFVTDLTNPDYYYVEGDQNKFYRELVWLKGLRLVVESMNVVDVPLELIEISPRLSVDLSGRLIDFKVTKILSDLTNSSLPVGEMLSSTGSISLFDDDQAFNQNNIWNGESGSIIAKYLKKNIQFKFYEVIKNVSTTNSSGLPEQANFYIPIKVLYSEGVPQTNPGDATISITLRDFFFYFESLKAPEILLSEVSLSQAVAILLDSIGFSNYIFKRLSDEKDPVIPFFFIPPEKNVAEILVELAKATQSGMFFDEYNNFVVMTKEYLLDSSGERPVDLVLYGSRNSSQDGINENLYTPPLTNIVNIASQDQKVYNQGTINYTARYIQRSYGTLKQSFMIDREKTWVYKPVLLWEVSGTQYTKTLNDDKQSKYTLAAMPLNSDLTANVPQVVSRTLINNIIDFGENIFFISRFNGYFYASGEIIKYDAVEYNVTGTGNVWITNNLEYRKYFSSLPFNGKIYPTGLVRIYAEPYYEEIEGRTYMRNGNVVEHGRGQFNTPIVEHSAGLPSNWYDNTYVQGCAMNSGLLYTTSVDPTIPATSDVTSSSKAGYSLQNTEQSTKSQRTGIIKNYFSSSFDTENNLGSLRSTQSGTVQSSALVFTGPDFENNQTPRNFITYVWKELDKPYKHIGTRMRIIGKTEADGDLSQTPSGGMTYYNVSGINPKQPVTIGGGSGGICIVNPNTNNGYYFEIAALSASNLSSYLKTDPVTGEPTVAIDNIMFYKIKRNASATSDSELAIPVKMWGGNGGITVDDGNFVGQYRMITEKNPTVYDIAMEYVDINDTTRIFYLYINQKLVKVITDSDPIDIITNSVGLFVRGTSKCMFENIYALSQNYSNNAVFTTDVPIASIFGDDNGEINASEVLNKYALSGMIQKTYLSEVSPNTERKYNLYYDEFGTTMRECAYFNIKFDRAYPALYASLSPTFNRLKGYTVSGFTASSYGAEFLIFNCTDTTLSLDETSGNYLRIQGVAFTQDSTSTITIDDYYRKRGNFSSPELSGNSTITSPYQFIQEYDKIRNSRIQYGKNEFSLDSIYIQSQDQAESIIGWISKKNLAPRKAIGIEIFSMPTLQLGDIVNINYKNNDNVDMVVSDSTRFVVYNIDYNKTVSGPSMTVYLSEV